MLPSINDKRTIRLAIGAILFVLYFFVSAFINLIFDQPADSSDDVSVSFTAFKSAADSSVNGLLAETEIVSVSGDPKSVITVEYIYTVTNTNQFPITDLQITNDLTATFGTSSFEITSISSEALTLNPSFNGTDVQTVLTSVDTLATGATGTVRLTVDFIPGENKGPYVNEIGATGDVVEPPKDDEGEGGGEDDGEGEVDDNLNPRDFTFYLYDVNTNEIVAEITDGAVINVDNLPSSDIALVAVPSEPVNGSIQFNVDGWPWNIENDAPFALVGDLPDVGLGIWYFEPGEQDIEVIAFSEDDAEGTEIGRESLNFTIIGTPSIPPEDDRTGDGGGDDDENEGEGGGEDDGEGETGGEGEGEGEGDSDPFASSSDRVGFNLGDFFTEDEEVDNSGDDGEIVVEQEDDALPVEQAAETLAETGDNFVGHLAAILIITGIVMAINIDELERMLMQTPITNVTNPKPKKKKDLHTEL